MKQEFTRHYKKARIDKTVFKVKNRPDSIKMDGETTSEKEESTRQYKKKESTRPLKSGRIDETV